MKPDGRFGPKAADALAKAVARKKAAVAGNGKRPDAGVHKPTKPHTPAIPHKPTKPRRPTEPTKPHRPPANGGGSRARGRAPSCSASSTGSTSARTASSTRCSSAAPAASAARPRMEERRRVVAVGDLATVKEGLVALDRAIDDLQARIERAETPEPVGATAASAAPELTFAELGARIHQHDAVAETLRAQLHERLGAFGESPTGPDARPDTPATPVTPTTRRPRTFKLTKLPMEGADIKSFQRLLNLRYDAWQIERRIEESGKYTAETREAAHQVIQALGLHPKAYEHGITPELRMLIRKPSRRTPRQREQAKARRVYRKKLQKRYGTKRQPSVDTTASANGAFMGSQAVAQSLAAIGHGLGLQTTSEKRNNTNPHSGSKSDHDHRNTDAYAYDISNGSAPTPEMDRAAFRIMHELGFKSYKLREPIDTSRGVTTIARNGHRFRVQVIYRGAGPAFGGNHLNHIHIGVKRAG